MSEGDKVEDHQHYSGGALLLAAVAVDMIAIFVAVFWLSESYLLSGLAVAGGAIITGLLVRRPVGRRAMWLCFALAAIVGILGAILQFSTMSFT